MTAAPIESAANADLPLLFSGNCFELPRFAGYYNPRIDAILLNPDAEQEMQLRPFILEHEGRGHRSVSLQGSILRLERHLAGALYSYIAQLLHLVSETGCRIEGHHLSELRLVGEAVPDSHSYFLDYQLGTPHDYFALLVSHIQQYHEAITYINEEIHVVYEIVALAWTTKELHRRLPKDEANKLELILLEREERGLSNKGLIEPKVFRTLYRRYVGIKSPYIQLPLALHALDVCRWETTQNAQTPHLTANVDRQIWRFSTLLEGLPAEAWTNDRLATDTNKLRSRDLRLFTEWVTWHATESSMATSTAYQSQFAWRLMALFDYMLFTPASRAHYHAPDAHFEECMGVVNRSLLKHVTLPAQEKISINYDLCDAALTMDAAAYIVQFCDLEREESHGEMVTHLNPLGLTFEWFLWLLLYESLYLALTSGRKLSCPLAASKVPCGRACPIRYHLTALADQSDLVDGPLCPVRGD